MLSLEQTPLPFLPSFDDHTPMAPKRGRRTSDELNRRVRANLNILSIPDMQSIGSAAPSSPFLLLQPQTTTCHSRGGVGAVPGSPYEKILLAGAMRSKANKAQQQQRSHVLVAPPGRKAQNTLRSPVARTVVQTPPPMVKTSSPGKNSPGSNHSLMSLRMAAMVKGSSDARAQLKFGGVVNKSFAAPGRSLSSPYRPSRALPSRNRSFNALCA